MLERLGINAKEAEKTLMVASSEKKNQALKKIAEGLIENTDKIIEANKVDLENGEKNVNSHDGTASRQSRWRVNSAIGRGRIPAWKDKELPFRYLPNIEA